MVWLLIAVVLSQTPPAPTADELLKKLDAQPELKGRDKPFEISVSLARLYFGQGRYREAISFYAQATAKAAATRALYETLRKQPESAAVPAGCEVNPAHDMELLTKKALEKQAAKDLVGAAGCVRAAVQPLLDVEVQVGHSKFLSGDQAGALDAYSKSLATFEKNTDARYSRAALLLDWRGDDLASLAIAKADLERVLAEAPSASKAREAKLFLERTTAAIVAGGVSKLSPPTTVVRAPPTPVAVAGQPPVLSKEVMEAFQNAPRTPEMQEKFSKALDDAEASLAKGQFQAALDSYKTVMPYQPDNPRVRAGMAWSLFKLGKPMADRVWGVATQNPESIAALGDALKKQGNDAEAKAVWERLAQSVPQYAPKLQGR